MRVLCRSHVASHLAITHVVAAHYLAVAALAIAPLFSARRVCGVEFGLADLAVLVGIHRREAFVMAFRTLGGPFLLHRLAMGFAFRLGDRAILVRVDLGELLVQLLLRSEEHTSELQSLMRISYAVFCLKKKKQ